MYTIKPMGQGGSYSIIRLTHKNRSGEQYLAADSSDIESRGQSLTLISFIEIANRWHPAIELGNGLRQTFIRAFTQSQARSTLTKFEDALKKVNHFIESFEGEVNEPINCILAILDESDIYFSTINDAQLLLWRSKKLSQITGHDKGGSRFSTVTSGELSPKDWLIVTNSTFKDFIENTDQTEWVSSPSKKIIVQQLTQKFDETIAGQIGALFIEPASEAHAETIFIGEPTKRELPKISVPATRLKTLWPTIKNRLPNITQTIKNIFQRRSNSSQFFEEGETAEEIIDTPNRKIKFKYKTLILPISFIILLTAGVIIIRAEFHKFTKPTKVSTPTIADLIVKTPANQLFTFVEQNLTIDNYEGLTNKQRDIVNKTLADNHIDIVTQDAKVADLESPVVAMDNTSTSLYFIDMAGQLWRYKDSLTKVTQASPIANPQSLVVLSDTRQLVSDQSGNIWLFDNSSSQPTQITQPASLAQGVKLLGKFGSTNLYIYQVSNQTIYKIGGFIRDIGDNPSVVVNPDVLNFGTLSDLLIPGDFIGATDEGVIKGFSRSKLTNLSIQYYKDNTPMRLALNGTDNQLTVARGKFISTYSTNDSTKINEKVLVTTDSINEIGLGPTETIWAAAGKSLYKL